MEKNIIKIAELRSKQVYPSNDPEGTGEPGITFREALILQLAGNPEITKDSVPINSIFRNADLIIEKMCEKKA